MLHSSLLVTLAIFKALVVDCRQEISLLSASLVASVEVTLNLLSADLEVAARAASLVRFHTFNSSLRDPDFC